MKPNLLIALLCIPASIAAAYFVSKNVAPAPARPTVEAAAPDAKSPAVADMDRRLTALEKSIDALRMELTEKSAGAARAPVGEIDAAVERALAARVDHAAPTARPAAASTPKSGAIDPRAAKEELLAGHVPWQRAQELWKALRDAGEIDAVIAEMEKKAENGDADTKVELGNAYLQKVFAATDGPEKGTWAVKADQAFDSALALDDHNWQARFQKAISLSFWPPIFGKQAEAVKQFEVLLDQQKGLPANPGFAQTHLMLGNLYLQQGQTEKAMSIWKEGLALYPDSAELQQKISGSH